MGQRSLRSDSPPKNLSEKERFSRRWETVLKIFQKRKKRKNKTFPFRSTANDFFRLTILGEREERRKFVPGCSRMRDAAAPAAHSTRRDPKNFNSIHNSSHKRSTWPWSSTRTRYLHLACVYERHEREATLLSTWGPWARKGRDRLLNIQRKFLGRATRSLREFSFRESVAFDPSTDRVVSQYLPADEFYLKLVFVDFVQQVLVMGLVRRYNGSKRRSESLERAFSRVIHFVEHLPLCGRRDSNLLPAL